MAWTRSLHITQWADTHSARAQLPLLVRRLVRQTAKSLRSLNFPASEENYRPGFDGTVEAANAGEFVPSGLSVWEMGVGEDPAQKAERDFEKRSKEYSEDGQHRTAFVFVTPRVWLKKGEWIEQKRPDSKWRDIIVLDANDLEHWLELAPDVDVWFTGLTGRVTSGIQNLQAYWNSLRAISEPPLTPSVFTSSREPELSVIAEWLAGPADSLFMQTNGLSDGLDFIAAMSVGDDVEKLHNAIVVHTSDAWRDLVTTRESLVLIAGPTLQLQASDTAGAVGHGHYVFVSGPRGITRTESSEALRRQDHYLVSGALVDSGFSESRAMSLAKACCGSSSILKRLITKHPETVFPSWSQDEIRPKLAPFALVGGWINVDPEPNAPDPAIPWIGSPPPLDQIFVTDLIGCTNEELSVYVARWQRGDEPLFLQFGNCVLVASREDAWHLLGGTISTEQLNRFKHLSQLVLEEDNPGFELDPDQRWMANLYGKTLSLSGELRRSFVETLALMATYPTADKPTADVDFKGAVRWILERVLPRGALWQRWASFGQNLTVIAEADPELFLLRVEEDLGASSPELPKLFQDQSDSMFSGAIHSSLLWALEVLAWSPAYISRVAIVLAKLASQDPGGRFANRPENSLKEIFLLWLPHTNATIQQRLEAISNVLRVEPVVGWKLIVDVLPSGISSFSHNTQMPRWRPWAEGWSRETARDQILDYSIAIANLALETAAGDADKWSEALDGMLRFNSDITKKVFSALEAIADANEGPDEARFRLWEVLREMSARHEQHADAEWAFEKLERNRIQRIASLLQPSDAVRRHHWLFGYHPELPGQDLSEDHSSRERTLRAAQMSALHEIISEAGADGIFRLLEVAPDSNTIGWLIGAETLLSWEDAGLPWILESNDDQQIRFIGAYIASRHNQQRWAFVDSVLLSNWSIAQIAAFGRCLPFGEEVWNWLQQFGAEVEKQYWERVHGILREPHIGEVRTAARYLIDVGRPFKAIDVVQMAFFEKGGLPSDLAADVLEAAISGPSIENPTTLRGVTYDIQQLVGKLQKDEMFDRLRLARIEWGFLYALDRDSSSIGPDTLVGIIASEPQFYVDLLKVVYRGKNESPRESPWTEGDQLTAKHASKLLDDLTRLPGTDEHGKLNVEYLGTWIEEVRTIAAACDRTGICDLILGQFIARATRKYMAGKPIPELAILMEKIGTEELFRGFVNGVRNSRGVTSRDPREGGKQEHQLAEKYRQLAESTQSVSGRLAEAFLALARNYEADARREDEESQRARVGR